MTDSGFTRRTLLQVVGRMGSGWGVALLVIAFWTLEHVTARVTAENPKDSKAVTAERFVVVDANGKERAQFGMHSGGEIALVIWNKDEHEVASLGIDKAGLPRLSFSNPKGKTLVSVGLMDEQSPVIVLYDKDEVRRMALAVKENGVTTMQLMDQNKKPRLSITNDRAGNPEIAFLRESGKLGVRFSVEEKVGSLFELKDLDGVTRVYSIVEAKGNSELGVVDSEGNKLWSTSKP
jgi:hypothetical protein